MNKAEAGSLGGKATSITRKLLAKERREQYLERPNRCAKCKNLLSYDKRKNTYCSHSCAASCTNKGVLRTTRVDRFCFNAGCTETIIAASINKYCSRKCSKQGLRQEIVEKWLSAPEGLKNLDSNSAIALHIKGLAEYKCTLCGWAKINRHTGRVPVQIHHVDGNPENNTIENLQVLCPNCHALTQSYKGANRGKGRKNRYQKKRRTGR